MPPKVKEDKTFGLKNKNKSKKVQNYVQMVQKQENQLKQQKQDVKKQQERKKEQELKKQQEIKELFQQVEINQKVPFGVDPKTVLCLNFKNKNCKKQNCKFSHDINVGRKVEKKNVYELPTNIPTMEQTSSTNRTEIVCKYFLEAVENSKYGWFWECPNGDTCQYRHGLPPGFVLKKKETLAEQRERERLEKENQLTLEDLIETKRKELGINLTMVTQESFEKWKSNRINIQQNVLEKELKTKKDAVQKLKIGMKSGIRLSGKDMFDFNPDLIQDEEDDDMDVMDLKMDTFDSRMQLDSLGSSVIEMQLD